MSPSVPQDRKGRPLRLGLRANLAQFSLLVAVNGLVGGLVGQERTVLPLLAEAEFGLQAVSAALTFLVAFGLVKAATNLAAGAMSDRFGRKRVLIAGWLLGLPVPLLIIWAPTWEWVVVANVLLGLNQGLTWSTTVIMKIDLVGPARRGLAMGFNEAAGYGALALTALVTGLLAEAYGLRPAPFLLGLAYAGLGLGLSVLFVGETRGHARHGNGVAQGTSMRRVFPFATLREPALSAASQAGLVNNLNDGLAWGLLPIYYAAAGLSVGEIGLLAALYPAVWGTAQLFTGALSDRIGRKGLIAWGMLMQAVALGWMAASADFAAWAVAAAVLGLGTAMVYPTLLAAVSDVAHPAWRASAVGVYRFWRDIGFAVGALVAGAIADRLGMVPAIWTVSALTAVSGVIVLARMYETHPREQTAV
ncbi:MAG TPA: MFS transporter [Candidatus Limnocylindria bacterium]|nr:MFS transporter [Candidatus Limnocylindria bacterium]